jgi:hypothetical protein
MGAEHSGTGLSTGSLLKVRSSAFHASGDPADSSSVRKGRKESQNAIG